MLCALLPSKMMRCLLLAAALVVAFTDHASAQTASKGCTGDVEGPSPSKLIDVLEAFCIPLPSVLDLDADLRAYGAYDDAKEFVLAYQRVASPNNDVGLGPLEIARYDKQAGTWTKAQFSEFQTEILPGFKASCLGSVEGVEKEGALFYVSLHLTPSASCQLVVSQDLKFKAALSGWPVAHLSFGGAVLQGSMVHFSPTHPLRLSFYDPRSETLTPIYPPPSDPLREAYMRRLSTEIPPSDRCGGQNCASDPEEFDNDLASACEANGECLPSITVNEKVGALAFTVQFLPTGFISSDSLGSAEEKEWEERVVYVYRLFPGPIDHREFLFSEMESRFGTTSLDKLLSPEMLDQIFAQ